MKNIEYYQKRLKTYNLIKWISIGLGILLFLIEFILSINGIDLFTPLGYIGIIIGILAIIIGIIFSKKIYPLKEHINELNTVTEAIEDTKEINKENTNKVINNFLDKENHINKYESKSLITDNERYFYNLIEKNFSNNYKVQTQIYLGSIVNKIKDFPTQYQNELNKSIDFGIFDKETLRPLLLIEINDKTHTEQRRILRDEKVKEICNIANIKLITFPAYERDEIYIIKKIEEELN